MNWNGRQNRNNRRNSVNLRRAYHTGKGLLTRVIFSVLLLMVCGFPLLAQEGSGEAAAGENESTTESSNFSQLKDRLSEETLDGRTRLNLLHAAVDRAPTVAEGLELLRGEQSSLEGDLLAQALASEGKLLALRGDLEEAVAVYSEAAETASPGPSVEYRLEEAKVRIELGQFSRAEELATRLISEARDPAIQREAALLEARAMAEDGRVEEAFERTELLAEAGHRPTLQPDTLLFHLRLSSILEHEQAAEHAKELLQRLYPDSPEAMLAEQGGRVSELPRPSAFLGFEGARGRSTRPLEAGSSSESDSVSEGGESTDVIGVQVGAFRNRENAVAMREEMQKEGFSADISESRETDTHRVVVSIPQDKSAQRVMIELKEKGFEGFLLFDE